MQGKALLIHYTSTARLEHPGLVSALTHKFLHTLDNIFSTNAAEIYKWESQGGAGEKEIERKRKMNLPEAREPQKHTEKFISLVSNPSLSIEMSLCPCPVGFQVGGTLEMVSIELQGGSNGESELRRAGGKSLVSSGELLVLQSIKLGCIVPSANTRKAPEIQVVTQETVHG